MSIKNGDVVTVSANATYYNGVPMPEWVKKEQWIVKSIVGDRAVIDKNVSGTASINSPIHIGLLTPVENAAQPAQNAAEGAQKAAQSVQNTAAGAQKAAQPAPAGKMQVSARGVELVAKYEGCRLEAYLCPAKVWTIGYGHTAGVKEGDRLSSQEEAKTLLMTDLGKYADSVNACISDGKLTFQPNQNQFDALTSFCYNCGAGSLRKLVAGRTAAEVADAMLLYNKGGGKVLAGLVKRREEERALFLGA